MNLQLVTEKQDYLLSFEIVNELSRDFLINFMKIFSGIYDEKSQVIKFNYLQKYTAKFEAALREVVDSYKQFNPRLFGLGKQLGEIGLEKYFYIFSSEIDQILNFEAKLHLIALNGSNKEITLDSIKEIDSQFKQAFIPLFENYTQYSFTGDSKKVYLGEPNEKIRRCKFCGLNSDSGATFTSEAHAISEGLGNRLVINNEECDSCNNKFGQTIEQEIIDFFAVHRAFYSIGGKNGNPKIEFRNAKIESTPKGMEISIRGGDRPDPITEPIVLESGRRFTPANVYRALVKYAVSVIDSDYLPILDRTIAFINGCVPEISLPRIAICLNTGLPKENPSIDLYITKSSQSINIPYIFCNLNISAISILFVVPFVGASMVSSNYNEQFDELWKIFPLARSLNWEYWNLNAHDEREIAFNIKMVMQGERPL